MVKVSIIINSWKEPLTIGRAIECIANRSYSGIPEDFEIIQASPDEETLHAGFAAAKKLGIEAKYFQINDPKKGKPFALALAHKIAKGEIIIMTDGDIYFGKNAVAELLRPFENKLVGGVSGRPLSMDKKDNMMAYFGHLLADAADHKRRHSLVYDEANNYYISNKEFFPMSGYIYATRNFGIEIPADSLVEDAYLSYYIFNSGKKIVYNPSATAYIKYPTTLDDYYKQKVRSLGGYSQLKSHGVVKNGKQARTFFDELAYFSFPIAYAKSLRELWWSFLLYPVRLITWIKIKLSVKKLASQMGKKDGWQRIESTK